MIDKSIVVGALMEFVGQLTTSDKEFKVGRHQPVYDLHSALIAFCDEKGLDMKDAMVEGWLEELNKVRIA